MDSNEEKNNDEKFNDEKDSKTLLLVLGAVILSFVIFFALGKFFVGGPTGAATIDDLHAQNIQGEGGENSYTYNGFSFVNVSGLWYTQVQKDNQLINIPLHFGPRQLKELEIEGKLSKDFLQDEIYVSFNPVDKNLQYVALASAELSLNMASGLGIKPVAACDRNITETCEERPIITCENDEPVIIIRQAEEEKIILENKCVIIQGNDMGLIKSVDKFLLIMYTVMT